MKCPTIEEVELNKDNQYQLGKWYRFVEIDTIEDSKIMHLVCEYFNGFTPELSKMIGWDK